MSAIKRFFEKKKLDYKFKKLGAGHSLNDQSKKDTHKETRGAGFTANAASSPNRAPSDGALRAAEAAMARAAQPKPGSSTLAAQKAKIRQEVEAERKYRMSAPETLPTVTQLDSVPMCRVRYRCELFDEERLSKSEMEERIESYLLAQLNEDKAEAAALMIKTLNKNSEKVQTCVDTLKKILQNITSHPGDDKYLKIRVMNPALQDRVFSIKGARHFLEGAGFEPQKLAPSENADEEDFLVMDPRRVTDSTLVENLIEILEDAEPIVPILDNDPRLFYPTPKINAFNVPDEFYAISPEELKREQQLRQEATEKLGMLRTKAMRERDEQRELRKYRFTVIRARFPDGLILQGTFPARAKLSILTDFIRSSLSFDWLPFHLVAPTAGGRLGDADEDKMLVEVGLVPSAVVSVEFEEEVVRQCKKSVGTDFYYVNDHLLSSVEKL